MTYKWIERAVCSYYYEQKTGKIVGELFLQNFSDDVWSAKINGDYLGEYISNNLARKAVEQKVETMDQETEELKKTTPTLDPAWKPMFPFPRD